MTTKATTYRYTVLIIIAGLAALLTLGIGARADTFTSPIAPISPLPPRPLPPRPSAECEADVPKREASVLTCAGFTDTGTLWMGKYPLYVHPSAGTFCVLGYLFE